jgi:hypothetical protein
MSLRTAAQLAADFPTSTVAGLKQSCILAERYLRDGLISTFEFAQVMEILGQAIDNIAETFAGTQGGSGNAGGATVYSYAVIGHYAFPIGPGLPVSVLGVSSPVVFDGVTMVGDLQMEPGKSPRGAAPGSVGAPFWNDVRNRRYGMGPAQVGSGVTATATALINALSLYVSDPHNIRTGYLLRAVTAAINVKVTGAVNTTLYPLIPALQQVAGAGSLGSTSYAAGSTVFAVADGTGIIVGDVITLGWGLGTQEDVTVSAVFNPATPQLGLGPQFTFTSGACVNAHAMGEIVVRKRLAVASLSAQITSGDTITGIRSNTAAGNATLSAANPITITCPAAQNIPNVLFDVVKLNPATGAILGAIGLNIAPAGVATDNGNINTTTTTAIVAGTAAVVGMTSVAGMFLGQTIVIGGVSCVIVQIVGLNVTVTGPLTTQTSGSTVTGSNLIPYTPNVHSEAGWDATNSVPIWLPNASAVAISA